MPLQRSLARQVAKLKQPVHEINPNTFNAVDQIVLPDEELEIVSDPSQQPQSILLFDSGPEDPNRLLIFSNNLLIEIAPSATSFQMDGIFSKCPKVYNDGRHNNEKLGNFYTNLDAWHSCQQKKFWMGEGFSTKNC